MREAEDLRGRKFNRLITLELVNTINSSNRKIIKWKCLCECGNISLVAPYKLKSGSTKSCGCYSRDISRSLKPNLTHGMWGTKTWECWHSMRARCNNPNNASYKSYGGRGIKVCDSWINSFEDFYEDMGDCPEGMSLDRIEVDGNYEASNCKWSTAKEQSRNRRNTTYYTFNDCTKTLSEWAEIYSIDLELLRHRVKWGWDFEKAISKPSRTKVNKDVTM